MKHASHSDLDAWRAELDRAEHVFGRIGPDDICCEGLTPRQASILRILAAREGARLSDLAAAAEITPSAMTRVLDKLEKRDLVRRVRGAQEDGRAARVEITAEGRRVRGRIDEMICDRSAAVMNAIPAADRAPVLAALKLFNTALEKSGCCGPNYCCDTEDGSLVKIAGCQPATEQAPGLSPQSESQSKARRRQ
jgi:DNA-binding MarR family transcriptional regulator